MQAKRRAHAVVIDHLVPPMMRAETYDELAQLEQLLDEYARAEALDPPKLPALANRIWTLLHEAELHRDLELEGEQPALDDFGDADRARRRLPVRDQGPAGARRPARPRPRAARASSSRPARRDPAASARDGASGCERAIGGGARLDEPACSRASGRRRGDSSTVQDARRLLEAFEATGCDPALRPMPGVLDEAWRCAARRHEVVPKLLATGGRDPGAARRPARPPRARRARPGSPTRGRARRAADRPQHVLASTRARCRPTSPTRPARGSPTRCSPRDDELPGDGRHRRLGHGGDAHRTATTRARSSRCSACGRGGTRDAADHRPGRRSRSRSSGRPRIDVTVRISRLLPRRVPAPGRRCSTTRSRWSPGSTSRPSRTSSASTCCRPRPSSELGATAPGGARRRASSAAAPAPTAPACCSSSTCATGATTPTSPRSTRPGAATPTAAGSTASRRARAMRAPVRAHRRRGQERRHARARPARLERLLRRARRHDRLRPPPRRRRPARGDRRLAPTRERVHARSLAEEARRVFRARVANPRWIASMMRHGYKGAFELSATVDYLFGYDATTGVVEDWMYEHGGREATWATDDVRDFLRRSNPWALRAIAERLLEAADRGLWEAPDAGVARRCCARPTSSRGRAGGGRRVTRLPVQRARRPGGPARGAARLRGRPGDRRRARARRARDGEDDRGARPRAAAAARRVRGRPLRRRPRRARSRPTATPARRRAAGALVELPVGATADRVLGTLDLDRALADGARAFQPGLLAAAHRGMLYVDEVNLLPDHLVDVLLDAAALGRNHVERDGLSRLARRPLPARRHDEPRGGRPAPAAARPLRAVGRGRPAAADPAVRVEIVRRRLAFDRDPAAFAAALRRARSARWRRASRPRASGSRAVRLPDRMLLLIAGTCARLGVDGHRADIVCARTATALAALDGADEVTDEHVRRAARLALAHRRRRGPLAAAGARRRRARRGARPTRTTTRRPTRRRRRPRPRGDGAAATAGRAERRDRAATARRDGRDRRRATAHRAATRRDARAPVPRRTRRRASALDAPDARRPGARCSRSPGSGRGAAGRRSRAHGRRRSRRQPPARRAPSPTSRSPRRCAPPRRRASTAARARQPTCASTCAPAARATSSCSASTPPGSMGARRRMAQVKGAVLGLLTDAYQRRDRVALVTFRGDGASSSLAADRAASSAPPQRSRRCPPAAARRSPPGSTQAELRDPHRARAATRPAARSRVIVTDGRARRRAPAAPQRDAAPGSRAPPRASSCSTASRARSASASPARSPTPPAPAAPLAALRPAARSAA